MPFVCSFFDISCKNEYLAINMELFLYLKFVSMVSTGSGVMKHVDAVAVELVIKRTELVRRDAFCNGRRHFVKVSNRA